jgi:hypothetical protein
MWKRSHCHIGLAASKQRRRGYAVRQRFTGQPRRFRSGYYASWLPQTEQSRKRSLARLYIWHADLIKIFVTVKWLLAGKRDVVTPFVGGLLADWDLSALGVIAHDFFKQNNLVNDHWSKLLCSFVCLRPHKFDCVYSTKLDLNQFFFFTS